MRIEAGQMGEILKATSNLIGALGYNQKEIKLESWNKLPNGELELTLHLEELPRPTTAK